MCNRFVIRRQFYVIYYDFLYVNTLMLLTYLRTLILYQTMPTFNDLKKKPFENVVGKGENAGNQHFLLFPLCFLPIP